MHRFSRSAAVGALLLCALLLGGCSASAPAEAPPAASESAVSAPAAAATEVAAEAAVETEETPAAEQTDLLTEKAITPTIRKAPVGEVKQGPKVEDTYFDTAAFLGDSRTDGFRLYSGLNRGTFYCSTGATVISVFSKEVETPSGTMPLLDAVAAADPAPERVFVMLGVNELGWANKDNFRSYYAQVLERLQQDLPEADILVQSILPVSKKQEAKKSYVNNSRIATYNQIIREVCMEAGCYYLDVGSAVTDEEGFLPADYTYDGVHLNKKGSAVWLEYLRVHAVNYREYVAVDEPVQTPGTPWERPVEPPVAPVAPVAPVVPVEPALPTEPVEAVEPAEPPVELPAEPVEPIAPTLPDENRLPVAEGQGTAGNIVVEGPAEGPGPVEEFEIVYEVQEPVLPAKPPVT